ncbi:unnamed protein product, partial [Prorocentrum cordatum]
MSTKVAPPSGGSQSGPAASPDVRSARQQRPDWPDAKQQQRLPPAFSIRRRCSVSHP